MSDIVQSMAPESKGNYPKGDLPAAGRPTGGAGYGGYVAFRDGRVVAYGDLEATLRALKLPSGQTDAADGSGVLVFDNRSGAQIDFDLRGTVDEVLDRLSTHPAFSSADARGHADASSLAFATQGTVSPEVVPDRRPGRPKLGVVSREISLLPRHWSWLEQQPQGISATLRRLVDEARKKDPGREQARQVRQAASKVMWAVAGNLPDFEEASRALFAGDGALFRRLTERWPEDVRAYLVAMLEEAERLEMSPREISDPDAPPAT